VNPTLQRLINYSRKYWRTLSIALVAATFYGLVAALPTYIIKHTVDDIFVQKYHHLIIPFMLLFLLFFVLKGVFQYITAYYMHWVGNKVVTDIRKDLFAAVIKFPISFFQQMTTGQLMSRFLNDTQMVQQAASMSIKNGVRSFFECLFLLGYAFMQSWRLTLILLVVGPFMILVIRSLGKSIKKASRGIAHENSVISGMLQEIFVGIREIKAFNGEQCETKRFFDQQDKCFNSIMRHVHEESLLPSLIECITMLGGGVAFYFATYQVLNGVMSAGQLAAFITAVLLSYQPIKRLVNVFSDVQYGLGAAEKLFSLMDTVYPASHNRTLRLENFKNALVFQKVSFAYDERKPIFTDSSLTIKKGECIGIVGPSGAGKSTLCDLMLGFIAPTTGTILVDNHDYNDITLADIRNMIGYVGQRTFLFNDTVLANVAYAHECNTKKTDDIKAACKAAHADEFIQHLPNNYLSLVGENGNALSGGQKQRITIARALLKNPEILIFDEPTSALDQESEHMIGQTIQELRGKKTLLIVSHRPSLLAYVDRVLHVQNGIIKEVTQPNKTNNAYQI
jgi:subfamily B ATP-binding cassette protein MsbA